MQNSINNWNLFLCDFKTILGHFRKENGSKLAPKSILHRRQLREAVKWKNSMFPVEKPLSGSSRGSTSSIQNKKGISEKSTSTWEPILASIFIHLGGNLSSSYNPQKSIQNDVKWQQNWMSSWLTSWRPVEATPELSWSPRKPLRLPPGGWGLWIPVICRSICYN